MSGPGTRTALNLTDVNPVAGVHRGDVITLPEMGGASDCLDVMLEISARAARPIKDGVRVRVHYGSGNVPAHVALGSGKQLAVGGREIAQLRLEAPVYLFAGDHLTAPRLVGATDAGRRRRDRSRCHAASVSSPRTGSSGWNGSPVDRHAVRVRGGVRRS